MSESDLNNGSTGEFGEKNHVTIGKIDQYELVRELGGGGFGTVYLARDTVAGIDVAVKGLPPIIRSNNEELENIRRNFALVSRLHHPNIAAALTLHPVSAAVYKEKSDAEKLRVFQGDTLVVMQYASGITISRWRKQFPGMRVPPERAVEIIRQIASALDYAHKVRILHRDIKPANVMIETTFDGSVTVRVLDFGLAAEIRSSIGHVSREILDSCGTRPYMAPEQWCGKKQGPETDQYALAVLFYELVCGEVPFASVFDTGDPLVMMSVVSREEPELPSVLSDTARAALSKALSKTREERFSSCMEFVDALEGKVKVSVPGSSEEHPHAPGKNRLLVAASAGLVVAGLVVGAWCWRGGHEKDRGAAASASVEQKYRVEETSDRDAKSAGRAAEDASREAEALKAVQIRMMEEERRAELPAFQLSAKVQSAHDLMSSESDETKEFFASEIRAFENDRRAGDDAKEMSKNVIATNFYIKALASATALKIQVTRYTEVKSGLAKMERAMKLAESVDAEETLPARYTDARKLHDEASAAFAAKRFDEASAKARESEEKFSSIRGDIIQVTLDLAAGHKNAKRWRQCIQVAEKVLSWEPDNAKALELKKEAEGNGVGRNTSLAIEAFKDKRWEEGLRLSRDADRENETIQFYLGVVYDNGYGVSKNPSEAANWYRRSADQGNMDSQNNLGVLYEHGDGVREDHAEAVKWYRKAAEQGNALAQTNLGIMYESGKGVEMDHAEAVKWYRKAAEQGNARGQRCLGYMYQKGMGVSRDYHEAVKWYKKSAAKGYAIAQNDLGLMYENGTGVSKDYAEAAKWYRKAADNGNIVAECNLADMYEFGKGVAKDYAEAVKWYRKSAEHGNSRGQYNLGDMYEFGKGVEKDCVEAVKWYRKSAEQGYSRGQRALGYMYQTGKGISKDDYEAVKWFRKAAEQGYSVAQNDLGFMYDHGKGVPKDYVEAMRWFRRSANQGNAHAQSNMGIMYEFGKGVEKDLVKAVQWYRKAAAQGNANAKEALTRLGYQP